tara:strand:+ start:887 stop:1546 length:660 start_codon:yes stop_codon:yes gene_type:complete
MDNYFSNINNINEFLKDELNDVIILPVLTSDIALNSGNSDYSNFAYSNFANCNFDQATTDNKNKELAKSKLKHSIIKNMLYNNTIKTRQDAEYYFKKINEDDYKDDKIAYYLDFTNEYNLLTDVTDNATDDDAKKATYALKTDISKPKNDTDLIALATDTYFGPVIFQKYNLIDVVVLCGIIIFAILIYFLKNFINIYIIGIILLLFLLCIVFLTVIFI